MTISEPEDSSEKEADSIAKKVVSGQNAGVPNNNGSAVIQPKADGEQSQVSSELSSQLSSSKGSGQSLDDSTQYH